jgi:hypothetical protein
MLHAILTVPSSTTQPDWELDATMEVLEQGGKEILNQLTYT